MWLHKLALAALLVSTLVSADGQRDNPNDRVRRLRFRRPRPRVVPVDDEEGVQQGDPVPIRAVPAGVSVDQLSPRDRAQDENAAAFLAAALQEEEQDLRFSQRPAARPQQGSDALESLFATAQREPELIEEEREPILPLAPEPAPAPARRARPAGRTRTPPGIPRRRPRPRAQAAAASSDEAFEEERGSRRPSRPEEPVVGTVERYSHKNEDGSFTFGYMSEDGSFREETRGVDCITRGKYGYIDPDGKRREFTYVSGLPCEVGEDGQGGLDDDDELQEVVEDPINPAERFRTAQAVQLTDDEIPVAARPRQRVQGSGRRPENTDPRNRVRGPPRRRPQQSSGALDNLLNIADQDEELTLTPTRRPAPRPTPTRARPTPTRARPTPTRPSSFDFDDEISDFTLNRPALTFDERPRQQTPPSSPVGPNFSSELVFNPDTGTFQTELRQNIRGGDEIRLSNAAAPAARRPTPTAAPAQRRPDPTPRRTFSATPIPQSRPTPTQSRPRPFTAFSQSQSPRPTSSSSGSLSFEPLSFPDPASVRVPSPSPRPAPTQPARPPTPTPTRAAPTTPVRPVTPRPAVPASPTPSRPTNSFFFNPGTPTPQAAPRPQTPTPTAAARPTSVIPANTFNLGRPQQPPRNVQPRPVPPQPVQPTQSRPNFNQPPVQFGFQPLQQQQQQSQNRPFTAFSAGTPPQLRGVAPSQQQQQFRPQQFQSRPPPPQQPQFRPQQFQARPPQQFQQQGRALGIPPQLQQQPGARFQQPFGRPPAGPPQGQQQFSVFNPNQLRGAA